MRTHATLLGLLLAAAAAGCNSQSPTDTTPPSATNLAPKPAAKKQLYIEVSALGGLAYFADHKLGMEQVGKDLGVQTEYVGPADYDMGAMTLAFEQAIAKKPNGIVVVGFEASLSSLVDKAVKAGIPVVTVDADLPDSKRIAFVGTGNYQAGLQGGKKLGELVGGKGKVVLLTKPGQSNLEERMKGYRDTLKKVFPGVTVVQEGDTQSKTDQAQQVTALLLQKYPDLAGIGCVEAAGGVGAARAVKEAGRQGKVKIVAMDRGNDIVDAIEEGTIQASVAQQTALMPYYAVNILYQLSNHQLPITTDNRKAGITGVPAVVDTGVIIVDKTNCALYRRKS